MIPKTKVESKPSGAPVQRFKVTLPLGRVADGILVRNTVQLSLYISLYKLSEFSLKTSLA